MKTPLLAKAVGAGLASTAAVASALLLTSGPPGLPDPAPPSALSADSGLVFCAAADRRLFRPDSAGCGDGTESTAPGRRCSA